MALIKSRSVVQIYDDLGPLGAMFESEKDPDNPDYYRMVSIDEDLFNELGRPEVITLTVEPGDKLNEDNDGN